MRKSKIIFLAHHYGSTVCATKIALDWQVQAITTLYDLMQGHILRKHKVFGQINTNMHSLTCSSEYQFGFTV